LRQIFSLITIFLLFYTVSAKPTGTIYGTITESLTNRPLFGVNIIIAETGQGASTNSSGFFEFSVVDTGKYTVEFSYIGYKKQTRKGVLVKESVRTRLDVSLEESYVLLEPVEVSGLRFRQLPEDTRTSVLSLRPESARILPGAAEDVMRTLQAMPGVVTRSDFSSQLIVRGSGPDQNLIVMDDIEVFNPYRLYGLISMFNPDTIDDINLITGGFPVSYGDRLSAVLSVTNKEGNRNHPIEGNLNTNITDANIVLEGRAPLGLEGSWIVSARRTYYDLIAGPIARSLDLVDDDVAFPNFTDLQSKITIGPYNGHRFYLNTLLSRDAVNIISGENRPGPDSVAVVDRTDHRVFGAAWHYAPSNNFLSRVTLSNYRNVGDSDFEGHLFDPTLDWDGSSDVLLEEQLISSLYGFEKTSLSQEIIYVSRNHEVSGGTGIDFLSSKIIWRADLGPIFRSFLEDLDVPLITEFTQSRNYLRMYGYIKDRWRITNRFTLEPGIRLDYYTILGNMYVSPRLSASFALDERSTMRGSIGRFLQSPGYEKIFGQTQFFDLTDRENMANLQPEEAHHYVLGIDRWVSNSFYLRVEGYYKNFINLISVDRVPGTRYISDPIQGRDQGFPDGWTDPYPVTVDSVTIDPNNDASGQSYGIEFFLEKQSESLRDPISGWISYSYAMANRYQYGRTLPFDFDQRHTLNVVLNYRFSRSLELGARWRYGSGFPHSPPVGIRPRFVSSEENGEVVQRIRTDPDGNVLFHIDRGDFSNRNTTRLPDYSRIDVRLNWHTSFIGLRWLFYLDVINILNRKNVINYRYFIEDMEIQERATTMFPILPTLGFSFTF
jgi:hypothetical protein